MKSALAFALIASVSAFPGMDLGFRDTAVFVPGQDVIRVQATGSMDNFILRSSSPAGLDGTAMVTQADIGGTPPLFYIAPGSSQLMLFVNATTLLHVNVVNNTSPEKWTRGHPAHVNYDPEMQPIPLSPLQIPLQIAFSRKAEGIRTGEWSWLGTLLRFELPPSATKALGVGSGRQSNQGVFFQCLDAEGRNGLFTNLDPSFTPPGCSVVTLHSYAAVQKEQRRHREL
ncbi:hypothetical protein EXIGLDRAFT_844829 [Exidia glandulosa HHB12029]|uniref:Uncharacterized protein n=1 Tax=Exidia glandulosa HHB12029 TaxID=1314781 RepID=A0A165BST4_EXIGL|nr:hypothetical protein EXIGLDRAFT_844829 [Exidia glandulosa HHB12029]